MSQVWSRLTHGLTTRRGAWLALAITALLAGGAMGALAQSDPPGAAGSLPASAESAVARQLESQFRGHELAPVVAVFTRDGMPLRQADIASATSVGARLAAAVGQHAGPAVVSEDGEAAMVSVLVDKDRANAEIAETVTSLRTAAREAAPAGMSVQITGGPAFGADIASAFDGANLTLLAVTIGVVALLLLLTYRSPVLWLVPLAVVALADRVASVVTASLGEVWDLAFDAGIISVLVFGAGTNYALLLISRYREELRRHEDHREALGVALRATSGAIVASNITVVLSLLTLAAATIPSTRGLGLAAAAGLVIALASALLALPAALAVVGRRVFWPFVPNAGTAEAAREGVWDRIATAVTGRPAAVVVGSVALLGVMASGLLGARVGLSQIEQFRVQSESATGLAVLAEHFPAGEAQPLVVIANTDKAIEVAAAADGIPGVVRATPTVSSPAGLTKVMVVGEAAPGSEASLATVRAVRAAAHAVPGADAVVGGQPAEDLDVKDAFWRDLRLVVPMVLAVVVMVLTVLLRAVVAPLLLVLVNVASALAAIGAGTWVGEAVFDFPALDVNVPLLAFLFLVALGIDYTIFLVHRARDEARDHGTVEGMVRAVSHTGGVITSAGVVLAAVFAALGVLPLVTLGQLGLIVGLGVLVDTLLVRTVLVPAVFALVGDRMWWPVQSPRAMSTTRAEWSEAGDTTVQAESARIPLRQST